MDSDREKNSASNESIFDESKSDFDGLSGQKLIFRTLRKCSDLFYYSTSFEKNVIFVISTLSSILL